MHLVLVPDHTLPWMQTRIKIHQHQKMHEILTILSLSSRFGTLGEHLPFLLYIETFENANGIFRSCIFCDLFWNAGVKQGRVPCNRSMPCPPCLSILLQRVTRWAQFSGRLECDPEHIFFQILKSRLIKYLTRQTKKDSIQQPDVSNVLYISWYRDSTDTTLHAQANHGRGIPSGRKRKCCIKEKIDLVCDKTNAAEQMTRNWYQDSKQILEKIIPEKNQFSPKDQWHYKASSEWDSRYCLTVSDDDL